MVVMDSQSAMSDLELAQKKIEKLTERMKMQKEKAVAALDMAAKTSAENARELGKALHRVNQLEEELGRVGAENDRGRKQMEGEVDRLMTAETKLRDEIARVRKECDKVRGEREKIRLDRDELIRERDLAKEQMSAMTTYIQGEHDHMRSTLAISARLLANQPNPYPVTMMMAASPSPDRHIPEPVSSDHHIPEPVSSRDHDMPDVDLGPSHLSATAAAAAHHHRHHQHHVPISHPIAPIRSLASYTAPSIASDTHRGHAGPLHRSELYHLLQQDTPDPGPISQRIFYNLSIGTLSVDIVCDEVINAVRALISSAQSDLDLCDRRIRRLVDLFVHVASSHRILFDQLLLRIANHLNQSSTPLADEFNAALITCFGLICWKTSRIDRARLLIYDLLRLKSHLHLHLIDILHGLIPNLFPALNVSTLSDSITAIVCDSLHSLPDHDQQRQSLLRNEYWATAFAHHTQERFMEIVNRSVELLMTSSSLASPSTVFDCSRGLELIALSRGWQWTSSYMIIPIWSHISSLSDPQSLAALISVVATISRTSSHDTTLTKSGVAFYNAITSRIQAILTADFPVAVQVSAVDAVNRMANGQLSNVRDVYKWFVSAPESVRTSLPPSLREDISFIGRHLSAK
uniref:Uncharacterized protein n=1 Tax=Spongospora subterranea TaxID=70186 RepID=A0A0H5RE42_9EUKA|eukprot:CRZ11807.1 hypothetical protein [Spongospora subterranea]